MCSCTFGIKELDISTRKQIKNFPVKNAKCCVVTFDNKFLVTAEDQIDFAGNCILTKWSIRSKKQLHIWNSMLFGLVLS